jgi:hypothetical protein
MNKKLTLVFTALLLGTALTGVAYAHWSKIITIDGQVDTGRLHLYPLLSHDGYSEFTHILDGGKGVAWWGEIWDCGITTNYVGFELNNVYPCLGVDLDLEIWNDGTIPAGLADIRWWIYYKDAAGAWVELDYDLVPQVDTADTNPEDGVPDWIRYSFYQAGQPHTPDYLMFIIYIDNFVSIGNPYPPPAWPNSFIQVDPGCGVICDFNLHFYEGLYQEQELLFKLELEYWNWNEVPNLHPGPYVPI